MSSFFDDLLSTPEALELFSERKLIGTMLRFEAALARAQAKAGLIPESVAHSIIDTCKVELFDVGKIVRESACTDSIAVPFVKILKETVGLFNRGAADFVHLGSNSQDVVDSAMALVAREAVTLIERDVHKVVAVLLALAERHAAAPMLARTFMQPASVTSFGLKCASWAAPLLRSLQRLQIASARALCLQLGGSVGTFADMGMAGKPLGPQVTAHMALELGLREPPFVWHTQRDEWMALGCELALLTGSLGKIAKDVSLMVQYEVGELVEPLEAGRGGAFVVPYMRNPVSCIAALAAAQRAPHRVAGLLAAMPQEHEPALGNWHAELAEWPGLVMSAHGAARAVAQALSSLKVETRRMRTNLDAVRGKMPRDVVDKWFNPALADHCATLARTQISFHASALQALLERSSAKKALELP